MGVFYCLGAGWSQLRPPDIILNVQYNIITTTILMIDSSTYLMCSAISFKGLGSAVSLTSLNKKIYSCHQFQQEKHLALLNSLVSTTNSWQWNRLLGLLLTCKLWNFMLLVIIRSCNEKFPPYFAGIHDLSLLLTMMLYVFQFLPRNCSARVC